MQGHKGYIKLPRDILYNKSISCTAKIIYAMIAARESWIDNKCLELDNTYTVNELADKLNINRKTVIRAIQQLEEARLIYAYRTTGKPTVYALYDPNIRR